MRHKITILYKEYKDYPEATEISRSMNYLKTALGTIISPICILAALAVSIEYGILGAILAFSLCVGVIYLFFKLMDSIEDKNIKQAIEKANIENENKLIYVCGKCGFVGSDKKESSNVKCPKCNNALSDTHITRAKWITLSEQGKQLIKGLYYPASRMNQIKMKAGNATAGTHEPPASVPLRKNMICNNCGTKLPDGALFCTNCGKKVVALPATNYCRFCGAKVEEHSKFCPQCGKSLA